MRFWDSSAIVPLLVDERASTHVRSIHAGSPDMVVWWGAPLERISALARRFREGSISELERDRAASRLDALQRAWREILPSEAIRASAARLLWAHQLRAADALQLAAALAAGLGVSEPKFVTFDARLSQAARAEGFMLIDITT